MQVDQKMSSWLQAQSKSVPSLATYYLNFDKLYDQRLWHELTIELVKMTALPESSTQLLALYDNFIKPWQSKMNKISLITVLSRVCKQKDAAQAIVFLQTFADGLKTDKNHQDAYVLVSAEMAFYKLSSGKLEDCYATILECEKILDRLSHAESSINASFYRVSAEYYKVYSSNIGDQRISAILS
jgi:26S proteasome regulatory subunit N9